MTCDWATWHMTPLTPKQGITTHDGCRHALSFRQHQEHGCRNVLLQTRAAANRLQPTKQQKQNIQSAFSQIWKIPLLQPADCSNWSHCIRLCSLHNWTFLPLLLIYQTNRHTDLFVPEEHNTHSCCLLKFSRSNRFGFLHHTVSSCAVYGCFKAESIGLKGLSGESHFL